MHGTFPRPSIWETDPDQERRIYGDNRCSVWAIVDEEDYHWAVQWLWSPKLSRGKAKRKVYLYRNYRQASIYLHVLIMERTGIVRPSASHVVVDHRNGNSLDCRRANLRWATRSMNRLNINGSHPHDLIDG